MRYDNFQCPKFKFGMVGPDLAVFLADCPKCLKIILWVLEFIISQQGTSYMTEIWFVGGSFISNRIHRSKKDARSAPTIPNLNFGYWKLSYLITRWSDLTEIWFVASPHDYIDTLYS